MTGRHIWIARTILAASLSFFASCQKSGDPETGTASPRLLTYTLTPLLTADGNNALEIELQLTGDEDGQTEMQLGQHWADEKQPEKRFREISVLGGSAVVKPGETRQLRIIEHVPSAPLTITYRLYEEDGRNPDGTDFFYAPVIRSNFMQIIGLTALMVPHDPTEKAQRQQVDARIEWAGLPEGWTTAESPGAAKDAPQTLKDFVSSVSIAGDFPVIERSIGSKSLRVAVPGKLDFESDALADNLSVILGALNENWGDAPTDYMVSFLSVDLGENIISFTGSGLNHAFAAAGTNNVELEFLTGFLAHEITHDWIPRRLGGFPENQTDLYWFSEGFTEYHALTLLRREGLMSEAEFIEKTNEKLRDYYQSPGVNASGEDIRGGFWKSEDIATQPYLRGFLIAAEWDKVIRSKSKNKETLNTALRDLKAKAEKRETGLPILTNAYLAEHFTPWIGRDAGADIERFYMGGETIDPADNLFEACAAKKLVPIYDYYLGFDPGGSMQAGTMIGLDPSSNAYEAGMREHHRFIEKISGGGGDTTIPIVLGLADGDRVFEISYFPRGEASKDVPQFVFNQTSEAAQSCSGG